MTPMEAKLFAQSRFVEREAEGKRSSNLGALAT